MIKQLTTRRKAEHYKHRLDKAITILKEVQKMSNNFEYMGVDDIFKFEQDINEINFQITDLLEDVDDN